MEDAEIIDLYWRRDQRPGSGMLQTMAMPSARATAILRVSTPLAAKRVSWLVSR